MEALELNIFYSELDLAFVKQCLKWALKASEEFSKEYGQGYAKACLFKGIAGKYAYEQFKSKNYNVGMELSYQDGEECMVVSKGKPIKLKTQHGAAKGGSVDGMIVPGFMPSIPKEMMGSLSFTIEREVDADVTVRFVKI